eukprot:m.296788 g.296788  ORF g.296788 m.296788 type:complete len:50 (+) comp73194_c0_seq1:12-161(+)
MLAAGSEMNDPVGTHSFLVTSFEIRNGGTCANCQEGCIARRNAWRQQHH